MRTIICDRCGATIDKDPSGFVMVDINGKPFDVNPFYKMDFCDKCREEIIAFGKMKPKKEVPEAKVKVTAETPESPKATIKKQPIDKDKMLALRKAGWTCTEISKEMGVSVGRVSQILSEMMQREKK